MWPTFNILRLADLENRECPVNGGLFCEPVHEWLEGRWLGYLVPGLSTVVTIVFFVFVGHKTKRFVL